MDSWFSVPVDHFPVNSNGSDSKLRSIPNCPETRVSKARRKQRKNNDLSDPDVSILKASSKYRV